MARIGRNVILKGLHGSLDAIVIKKRGDTYYVSRKPGPREKPASDRQKERMQRFKQAVAFAKYTLSDPLKAELWLEEARVQGRSAYHLLVSKYMKGEIDL